MLHIKTIKPLFTNILVTGDKYEEDEKQNGLIIAKKGDLKLYQTVMAVGSMVRDIKEGDKVMINPKQYAVKKYDPNSVKEDMGMNSTIGYNMPWVTIDDAEGNPQECLLLVDRDIEFVFEGEEIQEEPKSKLIMPKNKIMLN
jgi:co-chaperonin GroES (HSP10)